MKTSINSTQIDTYSVLYSGSHSEHFKLNAHYKRIISNIRKFNGSLLTYCSRNTANGKIFEVYNQGKLIQDISLLGDRYGYEIMNTSYKEVV